MGRKTIRVVRARKNGTGDIRREQGRSGCCVLIVQETASENLSDDDGEVATVFGVSEMSR